MRQFALFCVSGGLAFLLDAGMTQGWVSLASLDPWSARALSFPVAVTATWLFNRSITFRVAASGSLVAEWLRYVGTQLLGLSLNLAVYALIVSVSVTVARWPALAVGAGSIVGLFANFCGAKHVAFKSRGRTL